MREIFLLVSAIMLTWVINLYHLSVLPEPKIDLSLPRDFLDRSQFISKNEIGINQLIVRGSHYERGLASGYLTKDLIIAEEDLLFGEFYKFFPNVFFRNIFVWGVMRWFWGIDEYIEPWVSEQVYGVSKAATHKYDFILDRFTRQIAYHGIHEIGQLFMDVQREDLGCTFFGLRGNDGWILGRNFDFEVGRFFDQNKIMKWEFPDDGFGYLSVIWAGMVGAVTGINEKEIYISINAAGSSDFRRYGIPSTLLVTKVLMKAQTAEDAVKIIEEAEVFISDIYAVADGKTGNIYTVEKTPRRFVTRKQDQDFVVANHFISPELIGDKINQYRLNNLTTNYRYERGRQLIESVESSQRKDLKALEKTMLSFLRDKKDMSGDPLHLGNRRAIDALIATHSVIYNSLTKEIFVSRGPGVSGGYDGFDLTKSFALRRPIKTRELPSDPLVGSEAFYAVKKSLGYVNKAKEKIAAGQCLKAQDLIDKASLLDPNHIEFHITRGRAYECLGQNDLASDAFAKALSKKPAYASEEKYLRGKVF